MFTLYLLLNVTDSLLRLQYRCIEYARIYIIIIYRVIRNDFRGFNNLPLRSPDATPCYFFLWGYVKDQVCVHLPASIPEL